MNQVRVYRGFDSLPASVEALFARASAEGGFFLSIPWFRNLFAAADRNEFFPQIFCVESTPGRSPHLALPLVIVRGTTRFAPRVLGAATNCYTSFFRPIAEDAGDQDAEAQQHAINALAAEIVRQSARFDMMNLQPLPSEHPSFQRLQVALRRAGLLVDDYFCFGNWYLPTCHLSYDEYFTTLPTRLKNTLRRKGRQLRGTGRLKLEILTAPEDVPRGIQAFQAIYGASWKTPEPYPAFIPGLIQTCAEQGWLRLGLAHIDGTPAAAQLWIVCADVASIYKLAYDEQFAAQSVGSLLTEHLMQHVIDIDQVREVDYLTGDDAYKRDWMSHRRERRGIIAFNLRTIHGVLGAARHFAGKALRKMSGRTRSEPDQALQSTRQLAPH